MSNKSKDKIRKYRPRTEAQKKARRERDRRRREALRRTEKKTVAPAKKVAASVKHPIAKVVCRGVVVEKPNEEKRLVKVTVIKEYVCG